ncbi:MAG: M23 family metallopeptidase [Pyrinomonadaceae bacterium]
MQEIDKSYTFLLSHSTIKGIYIKRVALPKRHVHFASLGLFLLIGAGTLGVGVNGLMRTTVFAKTVETDAPVAHISTRPIETAKVIEAMDYSRPSDLSVNSGGPEDNAAGGEDSELDAALRRVQATTNPASLPTVWAHLGKINNEFGFRRNPFGGRAYEFHPGLDIDGERGDMVVAPAGGTVIHAAYKGGYGNMVEIDHGNGLTTRYGHLSRLESTQGDTVTRGQLIGYVGSTGRSTGPHLHYELRLNDKPINPRHFLPTEPTDLSKIVR